ncbi:hypothetical protein AGMMS49975_29890 [Clostridia bacterium]|nr:hypothetical protein AGMMS49975_29890 [Clostridia bacterium]
MRVGSAFLIDGIVTRIVQRYSTENNTTVEDAIRLLLPTTTYALLADDTSCLYLESFCYIYEMLIAELNGEDYVYE